MAPARPRPTITSYAFWGSGDAPLELIGPLLDDELPRPPHNIGVALRPPRVPRHMKGLSAAIGWLEDELRHPETGESGLTTSDDLIGALLRELAREDEYRSDYAKLIVLWPDEPTQDDIDFVMNARDMGIRVLSLGDALDDLDLTPYEAAPDAAPEAVEEAPAAAAEAAAEAVEEVVNDVVDNFLVAFRALVTEIALEVWEARSPSPQAAPFDGGVAAADVPRHKYWAGRDGKYRVKRGRPSTVDGEKETEVTLSDREVADITARGLLRG